MTTTFTSYRHCLTCYSYQICKVCLTCKDAGRATSEFIGQVISEYVTRPIVNLSYFWRCFIKYFTKLIYEDIHRAISEHAGLVTRAYAGLVTRAYVGLVTRAYAGLATRAYVGLVACPHAGLVTRAYAAWATCEDDDKKSVQTCVYLSGGKKIYFP